MDQHARARRGVQDAGMKKLCEGHAVGERGIWNVGAVVLCCVCFYFASDFDFYRYRYLYQCEEEGGKTRRGGRRAVPSLDANLCGNLTCRRNSRCVCAYGLSSRPVKLFIPEMVGAGGVEGERQRTIYTSCKPFVPS